MPDEPNSELTPHEDVPTVPTNDTNTNTEWGQPPIEPLANTTEPVENSAPPDETPVQPAAFGSGIGQDATGAPQSTPVAPLPTEPSTTQSQFAQMPQPQPPKKSRKKLFIVGGIIAGALAILIGGSALAYNLWYQNPNKVVSDALVNALMAKTVNLSGSINIEDTDYKLKVEASGRNTLEANSTVAVKATISMKDSPDITVDAEAIYSGEGDIYLKLNNAQELANTFEKQSNGEVSFQAFNKVIQKIDGHWIKISKDDLGDVSADLKKTQQCFADISKSLDSDANFRKTVQSETENLYKAHPFLIVGDKVGSRVINGQGSLGYKLSADENVADAFFTGLGDTQLGKKITSCDSSIKFSDIVSEGTNTSKDDSATSDAQLWVSRFGHTITEFDLNGSDKSGAKGSIVLNPVFNKNQPVTLPTDVITLNELKSDIEAAYEDYFTSMYNINDTTTSATSVNYSEFN